MTENMKFKSKKPHYEYLRKKWIAKHKNIQNKLWERHGQSFKKMAFGGLGGLMLLSWPFKYSTLPSTELAVSRDDVLEGFDQNVLLALKLFEIVPKDMRALEPYEERAITEVLSKNFDFNIVYELSGIRLNRNYGVIGAEQHLYRYPGDNLYAHADSTSDWAMYGSYGIAPNLGAWGYFAPSKEEFRGEDRLRERYYLAIQTFLAPGFAENVTKYREFFKFRKMIVVNPKTGQSVIAIIGDAGPAVWTGKHLGGSPEVMHALGFDTGSRKGPVLYFFIDDPKNEVPLGPIKIKGEA